ncbi:KGG domain-containing protein [Mycolicibacterium wolinskyi]|uniref:KGG domain-containing protein n=2 Tax=Mycolicibacterium wolinskyi TaxID=59750 RepID=UPI0039177479
MSGTMAGGRKAAATNKAKDPDFYRRIGAKGGRARGITKGFALMDREVHRAASAKGGRISRRKPTDSNGGGLDKWVSASTTGSSS